MRESAGGDEDGGERGRRHARACLARLSVVGGLWRVWGAMRPDAAAGVQGHTPLIKACWNGHEATAALLIDKGADVKAKDKYVRVWG